MPNIQGTTRAQTVFLRAFAKNPSGPAPLDWPSAAILRRWLRKPRFRKVLQAIRDSHRFRSDFHLAAASSTAAQLLEATLTTALTNADTTDPAQIAICKSKIANATVALRLAHTRQRFADPDSDLEAREHALLQKIDNIPVGAFDDALRVLALSDPNAPVGEVVAFWRSRLAPIQDELDESWERTGKAFHKENFPDVHLSRRR